jgi:hypothetical protein
MWTPSAACALTAIGRRTLPHWGGWVVGELLVLFADPQRRRHGAGTAVLKLISDQ